MNIVLKESEENRNLIVHVHVYVTRVICNLIKQKNDRKQNIVSLEINECTNVLCYQHFGHTPKVERQVSNTLDYQYLRANLTDS